MNNLRPWLTPLVPYLTRGLCSTAALESVLEAAASLPATEVGGFETRLTGADEALDLALLLDVRHPRHPDRLHPTLHAVVHGHAPAAETPGSDVVRECLRAVTDVVTDESGRVVDDPIVHAIWLEQDFAKPERAGVPAMFFAIAPAREPRSTMDFLGELADRTGVPKDSVKSSLAGFVESLPSSACIFQVGFLLSRHSEAIRLCIDGLTPNQRTTVLSGRFGEGHPILEAHRNATRLLTPLVDRMILCLDFVDGEVLPAVGYEGHFADAARAEPTARWRHFLRALVHHGLCEAERAEALLAWCGAHVLPVGDVDPALDQMVTQRASLVVQRGLHHVKLTLTPAKTTAKAYFGFRRLWARPRPEVASPESASTDPIDRAIHFLADARTADGFWLDFELVAGPSDEWVTAWVGYQLATLGRPDATRLAESAWARLCARRPEQDGWGYNAVVPADADSTCWAVRLADQLGRADPRTDRATAFLRAHRTADGVSTYRTDSGIDSYMGMTGIDLRGWTHPHTDILAACAGVAALRAELAPLLLRAQDRDGSWSGYWWAERAHTTWLAAEALGSPNGNPGLVDAAGGALARTAEWVSARPLPDEALPCAAILATAAICRGPSETLERLRVRLLELQRLDGGWDGSAHLRVPEPARSDPASQAYDPSGAGISAITRDEDGVYTTALAIRALSMTRDG
ncbi:MAG: prenyltransferase/squalene oxidase repeat-containing protein [Myxococcota bacterium]